MRSGTRCSLLWGDWDEESFIPVYALKRTLISLEN